MTEIFDLPDEGTIAVLDDDGKLFKELTISAPSKVTLQRRITGSQVDIIIIRIKNKVDFRQLFERLKKAVKPGGKIWLVIPRDSSTTHGKATEERNTMFDSAKNAELEAGDSVALNEEEMAIQFLNEGQKI